MKPNRTWSRNACRAIAALACGLWGTLALAQTTTTVTRIENTAVVSYSEGPHMGAETVTVNSNTVVFTILRAPTPAVIDFFGQPPPGTPGIEIPVDGGQCRNDQGEFGPLGQATGDASIAGGVPAITRSATKTDTYVPGEPVVVRVQDANRNADPAVREYVEITVTTNEGDEEVLRLQETGVDTGVFATSIPSVPVPPPPTPHDCQLSLGHEAELTAEYIDPDFPDDRTTDTATALDPQHAVLVLQKSVSLPEASVGDFLQYRLVLRNPGDTAVTAARIVDVLPVGLHYEPGSLRIGGVPAPDPPVAADGRTLTIAVGTLEAGGEVQATYVASVGTQAREGLLVNRAEAVASGGLASNTAEAAVRIRDPLLTSHFTIIGRVMAGECNAPGGELEGVPNVRVMLDDGTFVPTDENGAYHFEGVRPGTHVVQLDLPTLPEGLEAVACRQDTRFAGRAWSRFVEADGGALMRADFRVRRKAPVQGEVGIALALSPVAGGLHAELALDGGGAPVAGLRAMLMLPPDTRVRPGSATLDGASTADPRVEGGVATFDLGAPGAGWRHRVAVVLEAPGTCPAGGHAAKAVALFEAGGDRRTPPAGTILPCAATGPASGDRTATTFDSTPTAAEAVSPSVEAAETKAPARNWLAGQAPGNAWLLPVEGTSPPVPSQPVVVKHAAGHRVALKVNGATVEGLHYDGTETSADRVVSVTKWRGVPLRDGDNRFEAVVTDANGAVVETLTRTVRYAVDVVRAELVPEASVLVADGLTTPVIAVRMLDSAGAPVAEGVSGRFAIEPPHLPRQTVEMLQARQLAGMDGQAPTWRVRGNEGIAYIELQPTGQSGEATLRFDFQLNPHASNTQEMRVWLKSQPRDWIVVGFAKGTIGHDTLSGNMEALDDAGLDAGASADGQLSLYAKGRVLGQWMLTLAYDSDKPTDRLQREGLLSTIDPHRFYTLYGDGTQQGYDAASADKLYLKLERDQFYALFGDFSTGLDDGELTRYHRTLNGLKVEYRGPIVELNAFAAETRQGFARDELQGDGTSGLYRLSRRNIAINGERVRIEVRDRYQSERIIETRTLARHLDYDIDYAAGTLFFREPIPSRDFDFNPVFIVVEYETLGDGAEHLNAGGRVGVHLLDGRLSAGVTAIRDEHAGARTTMAGIDARYRIAETTELRAEAATSEGESGASEWSGDAYLVELEHHDARMDLLAYARRQDSGFGLGQQNASERGMFKAGADAQWRIADNFSLAGRAWHEEDLDTGATRDAIHLQAEYRAEDWGLRAGVQWVRDQALDGRRAESQLLTLGANRTFGRLELTANADVALGSRESVDFPARVELGASYALTDTFRLLVAQEFTDGKERDTSTTRVGFEASPWAGATLTSTLNQSEISEYGARTFGVMGLAQKFVLDEHWSLDLSVDGSRTIEAAGEGPLVVNPEHPIAPGGVRRVGALTEDFTAVSGGATYRSELWSLTGRVEHREGETADRHGLATAFLRQARDGVAFGASAQAFLVDNADGSTGLLANASLAWAWRPLGSRWSILDRLEFRHDALRHGAGEAVIGNDTLAVAGDARSTRLVNNFVLNYVGDPWTREDRRGNLFDESQRSELSLYYGSKYVFDTYDARDYSGYTDILGVDWRHDLSDRLDIGLRASVRHAWDAGDVSYAVGPSVGFVPFTNAWFSVGYNVVGFDDRDFQAMHYTAQGPYLMLRFKFDQETLGLVPDAEGPAR